MPTSSPLNSSFLFTKLRSNYRNYNSFKKNLLIHVYIISSVLKNRKSKIGASTIFSKKRLPISRWWEWTWNPHPLQQPERLEPLVATWWAGSLQFHHLAGEKIMGLAILLVPFLGMVSSRDLLERLSDLQNRGIKRSHWITWGGKILELSLVKNSFGEMSFLQIKMQMQWK